MTDPNREDNILGLVDQYVHGLLDKSDHQYVTDRIEQSKVWAAAFDEAMARKAMLERVPAVEPSEELIRSTLGRITRDGPRRVRRRRLAIGIPIGVVAALAALFVGVNFYVMNLSPSPYNLQVVGQRSLISGSQASVRIRLAGTEKGVAVENRTVRLALHNESTGDRVHLASFATDSDGTGSPRFQVPDWADGDYRLTVSAETSSGTELIEQTVTLERKSRVILSTDKPVYQPGQTILARVYALHRGTGRPLAGEPVVFEIADPKGTLIFRERTVASEFGIASTECRLATLVNEGDYTLRCRVGGTESVRAIRVERYNLPKFRASVELDQTFYGPGDVVRGTVEAHYFFGEPVAGGIVEISTSSDIAGEATKLSSEQLTLDQYGRARFSIRVPERLFGTQGGEGDAAIALAFRMTDSAGQTVDRSLRRVVTTRPLRIHAVAENGRPLVDSENRFFVFTTLADGSPVEARVSVEGLASDLSTGPSGVGSFVIGPVDEDGVSLAMRAVDSQGRTARHTLRLQPDTAEDAFVFRTDAMSYEAGGTMHVFAFGGGSEPVFIDLIRDGQTVLTDRVSVQDGKGQLAIDLPSDITGTLRLVAYRFDARGWPVRHDRVVVIRPGGDLRVRVEGTEEARRPGETAQLRISVADADAVPAPGALSLSVVDEAVFGVRQGDSPLMEAMGSLESELLAPIYAVYPWDPFETPEDDSLVQMAVTALGSVPVVSSRDEQMRHLVAEGYISEDMLDVLDSDRLEEMLGWMGEGFSPETLAMLRGEREGVHTLLEASFPEKARQTAQVQREWRQTRNGIVSVAGYVGGVVFLAIVLIVLARAVGFHEIGCIILGLLVVFIMIGVILPSLGAARRSSQALEDFADLRGLGMAFELDERSPESSRNLDASGAATIRVREWFPETLLWRPELVTDDQGVVSIDVPLADSITNWKVSTNAITATGQMGGATSDLTVFQPFFVDINAPIALTRGDVIEFPVVLYNYLEEEQSIQLSVGPDSWYELLDEASKNVTMAAGDVRSVSFRLRALSVGQHAIRIDAIGVSTSGVESADAIRRDIAVDPEGMPVVRALNGTLSEPASFDVEFPSGAVADSHQVTLKLYPSSFSQILEGLDGIFARPYGCFEQTSSTTYPNILALDYLRETGVTAPEIEAKALQYIHLGYQRLLSFEVSGGGFDWFGNPPANRTLTAYGLMEFEDMARVRDVDPALIARTRAWLLRQQSGDGSWNPEWHEMHDGPASRDPQQARLLTTAYISWAAFEQTGGSSPEAIAARAYMLQTRPSQIDDPYTLALVALGLLSTEAVSEARPYLTRLVEIHRGSPTERVWWERPPGGRTMFYGGGRSANVEATSLVALALLKSGTEPRLARAALDWLVGQRDSHGTWGTTQATVLALKALVSAANAPLGGEAERRIEIRQAGQLLREVIVPAEQSDVMQLVDLTRLPAFRPDRLLVVSDETQTATAYQLSIEHHELPKADAAESGLVVNVAYDRTDLRVGDLLSANATVGNRTESTMPMVMLDLPVPPGFEPVAADLSRLVSDGTIARFELNPRAIIVYLRQLGPESQTSVPYRLRAVMPVQTQTRPPVVYEYYDPDVKGQGSPMQIRVEL